MTHCAKFKIISGKGLFWKNKGGFPLKDSGNDRGGVSFLKCSIRNPAVEVSK